MPISPAREIAFDILRRVEAQGAFASDLLHHKLARGVKSQDAALASELVLGVLRWQRLLDFLFERHLEKPARTLDLEVRLALRLGTYQLRFLERVPARAGVSESVELVKRARQHSAAPLVNAVLRRVAEGAKTPIEPLLPADLTSREKLALRFSHPTWLVERWLAAFGEARTIALLEANNRAPHVALAAADPTQTEKLSRELAKAGLRVELGRLAASAILVRGGSPSDTKAFRCGRVTIQDEASQLIPFLLDVRPGHAVLDLCAAPGGKTAALARAAGAEALVVAADLHQHRLRTMRERLHGVRLESLKLVALDATQPLPFRRLFDRILVDAPCSGTGTLARNPEIRWRLRPEDLPVFHQRQVALGLSALSRLAPGGRLVYSTCSRESEENEQVVEEILVSASGVRIIAGDILARELRPRLASGIPAESFFDASGAFRTLPPEHDADGFFAVALEKVA